MTNKQFTNQSKIINQRRHSRIFQNVSGEKYLESVSILAALLWLMSGGKIHTDSRYFVSLRFSKFWNDGAGSRIVHFVLLSLVGFSQKSESNNKIL